MANIRSNVDYPSGFKFYANLIGTGTPMFAGKLVSNVLVSSGDALYATAGYLTPTATTDVHVAGVAVTRQATSVTVNVSMLFYPAADWVVFSGQTSCTMTQAKIWTLMDIEGTRGIQEINENATSNQNVLAIGFEPNTSIGAQSRVLFTWAKSKFTGKAVEPDYSIFSSGYAV